jgi:hypothetical protein
VEPGEGDVVGALDEGHAADGQDLAGGRVLEGGPAVDDLEAQARGRRLGAAAPLDDDPVRRQQGGVELHRRVAPKMKICRASAGSGAAIAASASAAIAEHAMRALSARSDRGGARSSPVTTFWRLERHVKRVGPLG